MKQYLDSDYVLNNQGRMDKMKEYGIETVPVDLNSCFVPTDKTAFKENFKQMQECRDRKMEVGGMGGEH